MYKLITSYLNRGQGLSRTVKKNILGSLAIRGISILTSLALVPLTIRYVGPTDYGVWLTLSSIIAWFGYLDVGMGNGLRVKLAEALARKDYQLARVYVSTTYASMLLIFGGILTIFLLASVFINWNLVLNTSSISPRNLLIAVQVVGFFFFMQFVIKLIGTILVADQRSALESGLLPLANIVSLVFIYFLTRSGEGSFVLLTVVLSVTPVIVYLLCSIFFFSSEYRHLLPSFSLVRFQYFRELASLGIKFMLIQLAVIVIFSTDNMIITQLLGPLEVTPYNLAHKYFGIAGLGFGIITRPLWSAYTDAYTRNDTGWIKRVTGKMVKLWLGLLVGVICMVFIAPFFYRAWVGDVVIIPLLLNVFMGVFVLTSTWNNIYVNLVNATGKIKLQVISSILGALVNIPLSILLARHAGMGSSGVILATCITLLPGSFIAPYQYMLIVNRRERGIWTR